MEWVKDNKGKVALLITIILLVVSVFFVLGMKVQEYKQKKELNRIVEDFLGDIDKTNETNDAIQDEMDNAKEPMIGMTERQLRDTDWGRPKKINRTTNQYGVSEQWVYRGYGSSISKYVYLTNGIVTSIQD